MDDCASEQYSHLDYNFTISLFAFLLPNFSDIVSLCHRHVVHFCISAFAFQFLLLESLSSTEIIYEKRNCILSQSSPTVRWSVTVGRRQRRRDSAIPRFHQLRCIHFTIYKFLKPANAVITFNTVTVQCPLSYYIPN